MAEHLTLEQKIWKRFIKHKQNTNQITKALRIAGENIDEPEVDSIISAYMSLKYAGSHGR